MLRQSPFFTGPGDALQRHRDLDAAFGRYPKSNRRKKRKGAKKGKTACLRLSSQCSLCLGGERLCETKPIGEFEV